ncbi:MAG: biliverdin-producing heme oxygenase [Pseudomonadota bacterium]
MSARPQKQAVREALNVATRDLHQALHVHPVSLALLERAESGAVRTLLRANLRFTSTLEAARETACCWSDLSLAAPRDALRRDLPDQDADCESPPPDYQNADALLGALYVAHGAQFGRQQLRNAIEAGESKPLPEYFTLPIDQAAWRRLLTELEENGADPERFRTMVAGAKAAFRHYREALDAATPYKHPHVHSPR